MKDLPRDVLLQAKQMGFSDTQVAQAVARSVQGLPIQLRDLVGI